MGRRYEGMSKAKRRRKAKMLSQNYGSTRMALSREQTEKAYHLNRDNKIPLIDIAVSYGVSVSTLRRSFEYYGLK